MDTGIDKAETETKPEEIAQEEEQAQPEAVEDQEVYVEEDEGDQKKPEMSEEQLRAAWRKEQAKRKEKQKLIDAEKEKTAKLEAKLEYLESQVGQIVKGAPPTLESCGFDEAVFQQKTEEYYTGTPKQEQEPAPQPQQNGDDAIDEALFYLHQKEVDLAKAMPSYSKSKAAVEEHLKVAGLPDIDQAFAYISNIAKQKDVDVAKAIVAIDKNPTIINDLLAAGSNQILAADILERAAGRVKTRTKKAIDSQPEPSITNKGPIDHSAMQVQKLRETWIADSSAKNFKAYKDAERKLKGN